MSRLPSTLFDDTNIDWMLTLKLNLGGPQKASDVNHHVERHERRVRKEQQSAAAALHPGSSSESQKKEKSPSLLKCTQRRQQKSRALLTLTADNVLLMFAELPVAYIRDTSQG